MDGYIISNGGFYSLSEDELYHHGVKGMKWGVRKKYEAERSAYKQAKKNYRQARRDLPMIAAGRKGLKKYRSAENRVNKAELDMIDAKAKYKAAKSKNAEKTEAKVYRKAMQKSGLVGSAADVSYGGRSTRIYNHLKASKGKKYADMIEKKVETQAYATLAASVAVTVGSAVVAGMLESRY